MKEWEEAFTNELAFFLTICELENPLEYITMSRLRLTDMLWQKEKEFQEKVQNPWNEQMQDLWWENNRGI